MNAAKPSRRWSPSIILVIASLAAVSCVGSALATVVRGWPVPAALYTALAIAQAVIAYAARHQTARFNLKPLTLALISVECGVTMYATAEGGVQVGAVVASLTVWLLMYHDRARLRVIGVAHLALAMALAYAFPAPPAPAPYLNVLVFVFVVAAFACASVIADRSNRSHWLRISRLEGELRRNETALRETRDRLSDQRDALARTAAALRETAAANAPQTAALRLAYEEQVLITRAASDGLRQPLRNINAFVQLIRRRLVRLGLVDGVSDYLDFVTDGATRMDGMVEDLLRYSAGAEEADPVPVDPAAVLGAIRDNLSDLLAREGATLAFAPDLPTVLGHPTQVLQLFQNLISNGVKFKRPGVAPRCEVTCALRDGAACFSVSDNGIGIPANRLADVFGLFTRLHERGAYEGTGIGLATCRRIVLAAGGEIWAESTEGEGTTFSFTWPLVGLVPKPTAGVAGVAEEVPGP